MSDADKRQVHTDALETLGTILGAGAGRDAVHIAVEPVVAGEDLETGDRVGRFDDGTYGWRNTDKYVGIVDPYLPNGVKKGQRFWLFLYPRTITSLRHVWSHPDFPEEDRSQGTGNGKNPGEDRMRAESERWLAKFAADLRTTRDDVMEHAGMYQGFQSYYWYPGLNAEIDFPNAFWSHWSVVTGKTPTRTGSFFSCSC